MLGLIVAGIIAVVVAGPKAVGNVLNGTHNYSDGFSVGFKKDSIKYRDEQYKK